MQFVTEIGKAFADFTVAMEKKTLLQAPALTASSPAPTATASARPRLCFPRVRDDLLLDGG